MTATIIYDNHSDLCYDFWQYYFDEAHPEDRELSNWGFQDRYFVAEYKVEEANLKICQRINQKVVAVHIHNGNMGRESYQSVQRRVAIYGPALRSEFVSGGEVAGQRLYAAPNHHSWNLQLYLDPYNRDNWPRIAEWLHHWLHICRNILLGRAADAPIAPPTPAAAAPPAAGADATDAPAVATLRVVVHGATGRMGVETVKAVGGAADLELAGAVCRQERGGTLDIPGGAVPLSTDLPGLLDELRPEVLVDFTNAAVCMEAAAAAAARGVHLVLGASGLNAEQLAQLETLAADNGIGIIVAPNFALGAVVLQNLAEQAAAFFDYVDIVESHHEAKIDAPSGFSLALAGALAEQKEFRRNIAEKENLPETRGGSVNGVSIHSVRLPGRSAHHEVVFGAAGQTLTLRHDTLGRDCYMPGVLRCVREAPHRPGLTVGLGRVLGL